MILGSQKRFVGLYLTPGELFRVLLGFGLRSWVFFIHDVVLLALGNLEESWNVLIASWGFLAVLLHWIVI
jgi:hypothetical protein